MSIIPYRKNEPERKRRTLDQAQVVRAALDLLDEVGMDELTMRRLAERLDVKAPSLYRHVHDKEELLVLLADEIAGEIPLVSPKGTWREQLIAMAWNARRGMLAHRDAARVLASTPPFGPRRLRHIENVMRTLRSAGLSVQDAALAGYHLNNFVTEFAADEARFLALAGRSKTDRKKMFAEVRRHFRTLPPQEYPTLIEMADALGKDDADESFQFGLQILLRGLEKLAK
ncbi:MAG TPA: TetR/AcrR family transcriptional regulator C-terminal domain-containing protein [Bryobacteraceae bacterium]